MNDIKKELRRLEDLLFDIIPPKIQIEYLTVKMGIFNMYAFEPMEAYVMVMNDALVPYMVEYKQ